MAAYKEKVMDYLMAWVEEEDGPGLRLERNLKPEEKLFIQTLLVNSLVGKRFNGGDICYTVNAD